MDEIDPYRRRSSFPLEKSFVGLVQDEKEPQRSQQLKKPFRRTGPLDAYIYKKGGDEEDVEQSQDNVGVHLESRVVLEPTNTFVRPDENKFHIFTDGACTNNGRRNASAAWGIVVVSDFGYKVIHTDSGPIPLREPQTNQRAELHALLKGVEFARKLNVQCTIWSDSTYATKCASVWGLNWRKAGWKKPGGEIQHLDLVKPLVEQTIGLGRLIEYKWVKGHKEGDARYQFPWVFNHQVDALATAALR